MAWLRQLLDWQQETSDPGEFLESLRFEITADEVFVFTPKGDVIALPTGATPVDFAYAVHTEVGHRTRRGAGQRHGSSRWSPSSTTATSSRCSPPRSTGGRTRAATG